MRHWHRTVAETLEKRAVKPSCWKRKTPTKMGPMEVGIAAVAVVAYGIGGMEPRCKVRVSRTLWTTG